MKISDFCITDDDIPQDIADKLYAGFLVPLSKFEEETGLKVTCSRRSGWRPVDYEIFKGRSGKSEHTFTGKGAADLVCADMRKLALWLLECSPYTRIAYYRNSGFLHVDFAADRKRLFFEDWMERTPDSWVNGLPK